MSFKLHPVEDVALIEATIFGRDGYSLGDNVLDLVVNDDRNVAISPWINEPIIVEQSDSCEAYYRLSFAGCAWYALVGRNDYDAAVRQLLVR